MGIEANAAKLTLPTCLDEDESLTSLGQLGPDKMTTYKPYIWMCKVSAGNLHANSFCQLIMLIERWMLLTVSDRADNKAPIKMFAHFKRSPQHVELNCNLRAIVCVCVRDNNKV